MQLVGEHRGINGAGSLGAAVPDDLGQGVAFVQDVVDAEDNPILEVELGTGQPVQLAAASRATVASRVAVVGLQRKLQAGQQHTSRLQPAYHDTSREA